MFNIVPQFLQRLKKKKNELHNKEDGERRKTYAFVGSNENLIGEYIECTFKEEYGAHNGYSIGGSPLEQGVVDDFHIEIVFL